MVAEKTPDPGMRTTLTPYRREVLERIGKAERPLSMAEALNGHPNIFPTLIGAGWATYSGSRVARPGYLLTPAGREALGWPPLPQDEPEALP